jgi:precorrin-2/cobalt-factor-2 C20-methyltransferase
VHKSSVYLPEALKTRLAAVAARRGRSEADLIRSAIERLVGMEVEPASAHQRPVDLPRPAVLGVGVGPGDPSLVTGRARAVLGAADRVVVASTDLHSVGRAEMVVRAVAPSTRIVRVAYSIGSDVTGRRDSLLDVVAAALAGYDAGELVAVALLGDPSQWTIFPALAAEIGAQRPAARVEGVPGITSYQAAAAYASLGLGRRGSPIVVVDNVEDLDEFLGRADATVVLYKASTDAETLQRLAAAHGRDGVVAELTGLPGERAVPVASLAPGPVSYLATVTFPATSRARARARAR